jgi:N-acetylglucosaminyldiphosphoundecaprenol N-acetyl-beta-D-mannosaminyltransferase
MKINHLNNKSNVLGVFVDKVRLSQALSKIKDFLSKDKPHTVFTPNAEMIMAAHRNQTLKEILNSADLLVADGAGVVIGSKILGDPVPERVAGFDLISAMFASDLFRETSFFLFGAKPSVLDKACETLQKSFGLNIVGSRDGYFKEEDSTDIIEKINASHPDILLVALGAPKQEEWIFHHKEALHVKVCIGVGGSFDVFAGEVKRAPLIFQKSNLEWLYRLAKEPWRYKRMLDLPKFMGTVLRRKLRGR